MASIADRDRGYRAIKAWLLEMGELYVVVGIRQEEGEKLHDPDGDKEFTIADVAAANEFGTEDGHIPERSFLRSTFDEKRNTYERMLTKGLEMAIDRAGDFDAVHNALELVGERAKRDVQRKIRTLDTPPNATRTIKQKGVDNPLIDTGRMRQSIDYEVK